jgi:hypothetical protein
MSTYLYISTFLVHVHISCTFPLTCTCPRNFYMSTYLVHFHLFVLVHVTFTCPHILYISTYLYMSTDLVHFHLLVHVHLSCKFPYGKAQFIWSCHLVIASRRFEQCNVFTLRAQSCQQNDLVWYFLWSAYEDTVFWKVGVRVSSGAASLHLRQEKSYRLQRRFADVLYVAVNISEVPSAVHCLCGNSQVTVFIRCSS